VLTTHSFSCYNDKRKRKTCWFEIFSPIGVCIFKFTFKHFNVFENEWKECWMKKRENSCCREIVELSGENRKMGLEWWLMHSKTRNSVPSTFQLSFKKIAFFVVESDDTMTEIWCWIVKSCVPKIYESVDNVMIFDLLIAPRIPPQNGEGDRESPWANQPEGHVIQLEYLNPTVFFYRFSFGEERVVIDGEMNCKTLTVARKWNGTVVQHINLGCI
jgi:hypothetical protein